MIEVFAQHTTPRLKYTLDVIFSHILNLPYRLVADEKAIQVASHAIYYTQQAKPGKITIPVSGFLSENTSRKMTPELHWEGETPQLFMMSGSSHHSFPFDLFAACFYMLSRYEEYTEGSSDEHQRFPGKKSLAYQHHFAHLPLVDCYAQQLIEKLRLQVPQINEALHKRPYQFIPTIDVDMPYAFTHKPIGRYSASLLKNMAKGNITECLALIKSRKKNFHDPFDTYEQVTLMDKKCKTKTKYFLSVGAYGKYDKNLSLGNPGYKKLIATLAENHPIGLHTSYAAARDEDSIRQERASLAHISQQPVNSNRNHYLKIQLPVSYRRMVKAGIAEDYSLCYHDIPGFRAGTSHPFPFYDLQEEKTLPITLYPSCMMDRTILTYQQGKEVKQAFETTKQLINQVHQHGGVFIPIFHNSTIYQKDKELSMITELYEYTMQYAAGKMIN